MDLQTLLANLTNPVLLFFLLGIIATIVKSDLEIPESSSKFISLYLLFAIGFKGGQELSHSEFTPEIIYAILFGLFLATVVPLFTFFILKQRISSENAGAVAATYGSVSAVTFVAAIAFLEAQAIRVDGHMVAVMALMESPAIIVGVVLMRRYSKKSTPGGLGQVVKHSLTNGSVMLILGSLIIGMVANAEQAEGIEPFTTDIFMGFLALFLLEMGMVTARRFSAFRKYGLFLTLFAILIPAFNGLVVAYVSQWVTSQPGDQLIFAVLAASGSYIAVPAAMRIAAPNADPGMYIPMALGVTFPFNITIGIPLYWMVIQNFG